MIDQDIISLDSFAADPQVRRKMEFAYDKGRVVWLSLIALVMTAAIAGIPFIPGRPGHPHLSAIFCWLGAAFFGACAALLLARAIRRKPGPHLFARKPFGILPDATAPMLACAQASIGAVNLIRFKTRKSLPKNLCEPLGTE